MKKDFLEIFTFFKMAVIYGPELEILAILLYTNGCPFEKSENVEKILSNFFAPISTRIRLNLRSIGPPQQK